MSRHPESPPTELLNSFEEQPNFSRLDKSRLSFLERDCDLCGSKESTPLYTVPFLGFQFSFVRCETCGLTYQNPLLDTAGRHHIYNTLDYWEHANVQHADISMLNYYAYISNSEIYRKNSLIYLQLIQPHLPKGSRILDIGCANGLFVHVLNKAGYDAVGIDISTSMLTYGRKKYDVKLVQADFEAEWPFSKSFDGITCFATLSNFIHPSRVFFNIQTHLRQGGHFFFNFGDSMRIVSRLLARRLYLYRPTVATIFSKKQILEYCRKNQLKMLQMMDDTQVVPLNRLLGFLRFPWLDKIFSGMSHKSASMRMRLLTGYTVHSLRE